VSRPRDTVKTQLIVLTALSSPTKDAERQAVCTDIPSIFMFHSHEGWCLDPETQWRLNHERELTVPLNSYTDSCSAGANIITLGSRQKAKHVTETL